MNRRRIFESHRGKKPRAHLPQLTNIKHIRPGPDGSLMLIELRNDDNDAAKIYFPDQQKLIHVSRELIGETDIPLYTGVTSDLVKRVWEHKNNVVDGFTRKYGVHRLVWYELHGSMESAIKKEKAIKNWKREWKIRRIEEKNPGWNDLYRNIL